MKPVLGVQGRRVVVVLAAAAVFVWGTIQVPVPSSENAASKPIGPAAPATAEAKQWDQVYARLPMSFEANRGQSDPAVQFLSRGHGYSVFLTSAEAVLVLSKTQERQEPAAHPVAGHESGIEDSKSAVLRMRLRGAANTLPQASGEEELPGKSNYFIGDDPAKWRTNVPSYAKVRYSEVYSGIDLMYYGNGRQLEYDFVVAPGADPAAIRLAFEGGQGMAMDRDGDLVLKTETAGEEIRLRKPVVYQVVRGSRQEVAAEYMLSDAHEVSFKVGRYDVGEPLVIDPVLSYSTYLGGNSDDFGGGIAVDGSGNAYLTGFTSSTNFPTASPLQPAFGGRGDAFIAKISSDTLTWILPRSGAQGRTVNVRLAGTNFVSGSTTVQISGAGITVGVTNVSSPTRLTTQFSIHAAAGLRARNVTVTTPGGSSNPVTFTVREPITACDVSLPLTVAGSGGNLNITAGIGTSRQTAGSWVVGWMVFNPNSVSFYGTSLFSGTLPPANPPLIRLLSASMAPVPAVGVLNAFYSPDLCGYTLAWASTTSFAAPYPPVTRDQVEAILNSLELEDFDGTTKELPR